MKIAMILNRLAQAPTEEEQQINLARRARHITKIAETIRSSGHQIDHIEDDQQMKENLLTFDPDLVFLQTFRADPDARILKIQELLEELGLPYTGSPPSACRTAQNKYRSQEQFRKAGLPVPGFVLVEKNERLTSKPDDLEYPLFIKPLYGGCSMGIQPDNPARNDQDFVRILSATQSCTEQQVLVEEFIDGREFTVGILGNYPPDALPLIEFTDLVREQDPLPFRLFNAKTEAEDPETLECPAHIPEIQSHRIQDLAIRAFRALGCRDYARVDVRCDKKSNPFVLELNVHPSLLPASSVPIMAAQAGIGYSQLFEHIFQSALSRFHEKV